MANAWKSYRGAPAAGTSICSVEAVPDGGTHCCDVSGFPLLLVRTNGHIRAYVNACPHQYLPLNHRGEALISADKTILRCTNHAAGFSVETGQGVEGLGLDTCLDMVPVKVVAGAIVISDG